MNERAFHFDLPDTERRYCRRCLTETWHTHESDFYVCEKCGEQRWIPPYKRGVSYNATPIRPADPDAEARRPGVWNGKLFLQARGEGY